MSEGSRPLTALILLWLAGNALRLPILAIPPLLALVQADLNLTGTQIGILNGLPVVLFAVAAVPGSLLIARLGAVNALLIGLLLAAAGSALRGASSTVAVLYAATVVMGAGIAVMQPALPSTVRQWTPSRIGFATAVSTNGILVGEILPVAFMPAVLLLLSDSWRAALVFWSVPLAIIAAIIFLCQPKATAAPVPSGPRRWMPDWRDPLLWKLGIALGASNQFYFCTNAFLPGYLTDAGRADLIVPALTALNIGQLPASFMLLAMASRWERRAWPFVAAGAIALAGLFFVVTTASVWTVVAAGVVGFAIAWTFTLQLALPALLAAPADVPRMSAGMFTIGYGIAMAISVLAGFAWDVTGIPAFAFLPIALAGLPLLLVSPLIDFSRRAN